ncbi:pentapeptide repeat-containing protein [Streptomyces avidinii]|uniref:pentapeptide repeat-containing protein n=1 Tax=Streptomyces avidinii TaxID=1895 RepID=UPI0037BBEFC0
MPFRLMNGVVVMGSSCGDGSSAVPRRQVRGHRGTLSRGPPAQHRPTGLQPGADVVSGVIRLRGRPDHLGADANMTEADLTGTDLCQANLTKANLTDARMTDARMSSADLTGADLSRADLRLANMTEADLTGVDLCRADLTGAQLTGADLLKRLADARKVEPVGEEAVTPPPFGARPDCAVQLLRASGCPAKLTPARPWAMRLRMLPWSVSFGVASTLR